MKLLIHEQKTPGHYLYHVRLITEAALARGIATEWSLPRSAPDTAEYRHHLASLAGRVSAVHWFDPRVGAPPRTAFLEAGRACIRAAVASGAGHIIAPSADGLAPVLGIDAWGGARRILPKGVELEVGLIRPTFAHAGHRGARQIKMAAVQWAVSRAPIGAMRIADFPAYERMKRMAWARRQRLLAVPEPCEPSRLFTRDEARAFLGLPAAGRLVIAPGEISSRKYPLELARAFSSTATPDSRLVFAGRFVDGLYERLADQFGREILAGRIIVVNRLLTDEELDAAVGAADLVAAAYGSNPGPSGILDRAMMVDRPVLAHNYGWAEYMVKRFKLGWTTDPHDAEAYAAAMRAALEGAADFRPSAAVGWLKSFFSMENFKRHWMMRIRDRMGLPPEEMVLWEGAPDFGAN